MDRVKRSVYPPMSRPSGPAAAPRPTLRRRPHLGRDLVVRPRLHAALDNHGGSALTLVSAAAGSGKTTLLLSWVAARPDNRIAWVEPSEGEHFWSACADAVADALETASISEEDETPLEALVRTFASLDEPLTLVVDDFHEVE